MKKTFILISLGILIFGLHLLGVFTYIHNAPDLIRNFPAKLACSLRYISGFEQKDIRHDIHAYSWAFSLGELSFEDESRSVASRFLGKSVSYTFTPEFGCIRAAYKQIGTMPTPKEHQPHIRLRSPKLDKTLFDIASQDNVEDLDTRALLVATKDRIIGEWYGDGYGVDTPFLGWSMSKTYFAIIAGAAIKAGIIAEETSALFPSWTDRRQAISFADLLSMSSGLDFDETYTPGKDATKMLFVDHAIASTPISKKLKYLPGEVWQYSSGDTNLASQVLYHNFNRSISAFKHFVQYEVNEKLALHDVFFEHDNTGTFIASSFTFMCARSWSKIGLEFLNENQKVLNAQFVQQATTPIITKSDDRYGYNLWLNTGKRNPNRRYEGLPDHVFYAKGNKGQFILIDNENKLVIVRLGWSSEKYPIARLYNKVAQSL